MRVLFVPFRETWENDEQKKILEFSASSRFRCDWIAKYLDNSDVWKKTNAHDSVNPFDYDIYIFQKTLTPPFLQMMRDVKNAGKKIIFDLCDAEWEKGHADRLREAVKLSDVVTVSSFYLFQKMRELYGKPAELVVDRLDLASHPSAKVHSGVGKSVVWFGNRNTIEYIECMTEALNEANKKTPFTLEVISDKFEKMPKVDMPVTYTTWTEKTANDCIKRNDVAINPHAVDSVGLAKSDNKTITAWALGLPVVSHGKQHHMACVLSAWLASAEKRNEASRIGRALVEQLYDIKLSALEYQSIIRRLS